MKIASLESCRKDVHPASRRLLVQRRGILALAVLVFPGSSGLAQHGNAAASDMLPRLDHRPGPLRAGDVRRPMGLGNTQAMPASAAQKLERAEKKNVLESLRACGGNRTLAAERLKLHRRSLYKKRIRWDLLHEGHTGVPETQDSEYDEKF